MSSKVAMLFALCVCTLYLSTLGAKEVTVESLQKQLSVCQTQSDKLKAELIASKAEVARLKAGTPDSGLSQKLQAFGGEVQKAGSVLGTRTMWWLNRTWHAGLDAASPYVSTASAHASHLASDFVDSVMKTFPEGNSTAGRSFSAVSSGVCYVADNSMPIWGKPSPVRGGDNSCTALELLLGVLHLVAGLAVLSVVYHILVIITTLLYRVVFPHNKSSTVSKAKASPIGTRTYSAAHPSLKSSSPSPSPKASAAASAAFKLLSDTKKSPQAQAHSKIPTLALSKTVTPTRDPAPPHVRSSLDKGEWNSSPLLVQPKKATPQSKLTSAKKTTAAVPCPQNGHQAKTASPANGKTTPRQDTEKIPRDGKYIPSRYRTTGYKKP